MATFSNYKGKTRVQVCVKGVRKSKVFETKTEAKAWALSQEHSIREQGNPAKMTFSELGLAWLERYPNRQSIVWETRRLTFLMKGDIGETLLSDLNKKAVADWRDERLKTVSPGTVLRDWNLLSSICTAAVEEMALLIDNPFTRVSKPEEPAPRDRIATPGELERIEYCSTGQPKWERVFNAFEFAVQTGMSIGEVAALRWTQKQDRVLNLPKFKKRPPRQVPLSTKANDILESRRGQPESKLLVFGFTASQIDTGWRGLCKFAAVDDLMFHDARHMAATWLSKKMDVLALAKMLGHRDLKMLLNVYYKADAASLVDKLD